MQLRKNRYSDTYYVYIRALKFYETVMELEIQHTEKKVIFSFEPAVIHQFQQFLSLSR